jgi:hypothetical protein
VEDFQARSPEKQGFLKYMEKPPVARTTGVSGGRRLLMSTPCALEIPAGWEKLSKQTRAVIVGLATRFLALAAEVASKEVPREPGQLLDEEADLHQRAAQQCLDPLTAMRIRAAHEDERVLEQAEMVARTAGCSPQRSSERVSIMLLGGTSLSVQTPYFLKRRPKDGRRKKVRGASGNGIYPILAVLGIHFRGTPALASEVVRLVALGTLEEARQSLAIRGIRLGLKRIQGLAQKLARRALSYREWCIAQAKQGRRGAGESLRGKRLAVATDGGRIRIKVYKRGRPRKSGRRGFAGNWQEPKVLVVYELDQRGRKRARGVLRYDATMGDADKLFEILTGLLCEVGAQEADEWVLVGDGASWIWKRVPGLVEALGYDQAKVKEVVDFYHAVQRLHEVAAEVKSWSEADRRAWVSGMKQHLRRGEPERIVADGKALCQGRRAKKIRSLLQYFETHADRMRYPEFKKLGIPQGSGVVESAVRRIVNLRLKGNGIFWLLVNAEAVLHLRSQLLSGRWNEFVRLVLRPMPEWDAQMPEDIEIAEAA